MKRVTSPLLLSLFAAVVVAAPGTAQSPSPAMEFAPLAEAVGFAPLGVTSIMFTDWAAAKAAHGYADITSATPLDQRIRAMIDLGKVEAPFAGYAIDRFATHAESWGWDTTDLDWEASFAVEGPPVAVLRFRDGFDLAPVIAHFDDRGFSSEVYGDATIRSHPMALSAAWIRDSDFGILNTAILDDGRTFVLSSGIDGVKAALDARHVDSFRAAPAQVVAGALGAPLSAGIDVGPDACAAYGPHLGPRGSDANDALLTEVGPLRAWEAMGVGTFRDAAGTAAGRFAFEYGDPSDALSDLAGRAQVADRGISLRTAQPYASSLFRLLTSDADANVLTLDMVPVDDRPQHFAQAFVTRDLVFATCG